MAKKAKERMNDRILITGLGAVSSLGLTVRDHAEAGARWTFADVDEAANAEILSDHSHEKLSIDSSFSIKNYVSAVGLRRKQRFSQLAMAAAVDAFASGKFADLPANLERVGMVASTEYGPQRVVCDYLDGLVQKGLVEASPGLFTQTVYNVANGQASLALGLKGANSTLVGGSAVAYAAGLIASEKADAIFALSLDETNDLMSSYFDSILGEALDLEFPFRTGEASAVVVLESESSAAERGAKPFGELLGVSIASAAVRGLSYLEWEDDDDTIEYTLRSAMDDAGVGIDEIDLVVCTGNGLSGLTRSEFAALRALGHKGPVIYPRLATGECFGGNEALAYVLGLETSEPGDMLLVTVTTANGGVTSTVVRKAES